VATNESTVFAKGIRNPQGLTVDSKGRIWETEQGPRGGDELNLIVEGQSYGWPDSTYGTDYGPRPWPLNPEQGVHKTGTTPQFAWNPSIAVSNLIEVTGNEFPLWKGDLLVLSLVGQTVHRLRLDGTRVVYDEPITFELNRLRDIAELPSGQIALLTDHGAVILLRNSEAHGGRPFMQQQTTSTSEDLASKGAENNSNSSNAVGQEQQFLTDSAFRGESVFKANCASCHSLAKESTAAGPSLNGIVGRRVGSAEFPYSAALTGRLESWTSRQIVDFATHPNDAYSGTIMMPVPLSPDLKHDLESYLQAIGH
jgi:cytochrome c2